MRPVADVAGVFDPLPAKELEPSDVVVAEGEVSDIPVRLIACGGKREFGWLQAQYKHENRWCCMPMSYATQALLVLLAKEKD